MTALQQAQERQRIYQAFLQEAKRNAVAKHGTFLTGSQIASIKAVATKKFNKTGL